MRTGLRQRPGEHALAAAVLAFILCAMYFPYIFGDLNLMSGAHDDPSVTALGGPNGDPTRPIVQSHWKLLDPGGSALLDEPTFPLVHHELFVDRDVPLWNPDAAFGTPLAAAMQQQPFYPLGAVVMAAPSPVTFAAYLMLRLFVAGFATYLFLRFFVGFVPALGGGVAFMLNGYFVKYGTMPHLSVETLTGALFLGVEYVLRARKPWFAVPFLAIVVWFDFLGGMPESSLVTIVFATLYAAFRIVSVRAYRVAWLARSREVALALGCGFACAAFLILPFLELVANSWNIHEPAKNGGAFPGFSHNPASQIPFAGLVYDATPKTSLASYAMPLLFGPPWEAIGLPFNDGHFGVVIMFCALAAVAFVALRPRGELARPIGFFAAAVALLVAKRYGFAAVNWIGGLPVVRVVLLMKYDEAAIAFAMAALVGFGLHALFSNPERRRTIAACAFVTTLAALQLAYDGTARLTNDQQPLAATYFFAALLGALVALLVVAAISALAAIRKSGGTRDAVFGTLAILALATEMSLNYFVPMYYFVDPGPPKKQNPYLGAPYVAFLHEHASHAARVYAERTTYLEPDWAQAFDLKDIRDIDAIYDQRYLPFVRAFIPKSDRTDLIEDFTGTSAYTMATPVGQTFLALGSVKYVVTDNMQDPTSLGSRIGAYVAQMKAPAAPQVGQFQLGNAWRDGFAQTRAARVLNYDFDVPTSARALALAYGVDDSLWSARGAVADASLQIVNDRGVARTVIVRRFDSRRAASRGWHRDDVDVRRYAGKHVRLVFAFHMNSAADGATGYWGSIREERAPGEPDPFVLAAHYPDINVFAFARPLPHGALYDHVTLSPDDATTLDTLTDSHFDPYTDAVISRESVPPAIARSIGELTSGRRAAVRGATLDSYTATRIAYRTNDANPALLFLSDTFYPGWKAFVDSRETPIVRADYLFRGVVLGPGKHTVEFRYEPATFRIGLALCAASLIVLALFSVRSKRASAALCAAIVVA